ncbi:MAG: hypothetical protein C5B50_11500 [Verrucomicrobia bacterium]|nr:MAG: hypothetical protein C5B50_11500 [Verrucomicrobiota bacterium]
MLANASNSTDVGRVPSPGAPGPGESAERRVGARGLQVAGTGALWAGRLLMLALNFIPLLHAASTVIALLAPYATSSVRIPVALFCLYLAPPLVARLLLAVWPLQECRIAVGTKPFFVWWMLFQLQVIFCRLPTLEEVLRLIPGLYSQWLRLWGARIGRLTYWSAGTLITDRSFLWIGDDVVFGAGVRLNAHVITKNKNGALELLLAPVKIGDRVMIGGYSLLTSGTEVLSDQATRAFLIAPPFSAWKEGERVRRQQSLEIE